MATTLQERPLDHAIELYQAGVEAWSALAGGRPQVRTDLPQFAEALVVLAPLAQAGVVEAQEVLATMYEFGLGVDPDAVEAVRLYEHAAAQGSGLAANNLCTLYANGAPGIPKDAPKERHWWRRANELGFPHRAPLAGGDGGSGVES